MEKAAAARAVASIFSERFKQQQLPAWRPLFTPGPVLTTLWVIGAALVGIAIAVLITDQNVREVVINYDEYCDLDVESNGTNCVVDYDLEVPLRLPVYVYYELDNYYQNYRLYAKSRNQQQLEGENVTELSALSDCAPMDSFNHSTNPSDFYFPCGLIAWSMFNDTFNITLNNDTEPIKMRKDGIAWKSDVEMYNYNPENITANRVIDNITDEDFLVWMRVAAFPNFRKLYRIIDEDAVPNATELSGTLHIEINNRYNVSDFGNKTLVLTEISWLGGKNTFIGYLYVGVGALYLLFAIVFTGKQLIAPRKFGDPRMLPWNATGFGDGGEGEDEYEDAEIVEVAQARLAE